MASVIQDGVTSSTAESRSGRSPNAGCACHIERDAPARQTVPASGVQSDAFGPPPAARSARDNSATRSHVAPGSSRRTSVPSPARFSCTHSRNSFRSTGPYSWPSSPRTIKRSILRQHTLFLADSPLNPTGRVFCNDVTVAVGIGRHRKSHGPLREPLQRTRMVWKSAQATGLRCSSNGQSSSSRCVPCRKPPSTRSPAHLRLGILRPREHGQVFACNY